MRTAGLIVLDGNFQGHIQSLFTENEIDTAFWIAGKWREKGWKPHLYSKTYDGTFITLCGESRYRRAA